MPAASFFFYDLETSGRDYKRHRIIQFAGRRTDLNLQPIGEPVEFYVKLADEVVPEPRATLITGITPAYTREHGIGEPEAMVRIMEECFTPDTIIVGYNNVRFDDEYIRYTAYRNFWDPYEWAWKDGRSRWDLLDIVRLVRALRPDGITWPFTDEGDPINKLELITKANGVTHLKAHDAMSDVDALIEVARLIRQHQPRMFDYLLDLRGKQAVSDLVDPAKPQPFIYASGMYGKAHDFVSPAAAVARGENGKAIIWDLRFAPDDFKDLSIDELRLRLFSNRAELEALGLSRLPVKELSPNKCPAVAPWAALRPDDATRLQIDRAAAQTNLDALLKTDLPKKLYELYHRRPDFVGASDDVDGALYNGFINAQSDKSWMLKIRRAARDELAQLKPQFEDRRLTELWLRYRGRNAPETLIATEQTAWQAYVAERHANDVAAFHELVKELSPKEAANPLLKLEA